MITNLKMIKLLKDVNCADIKNNQYLSACYDVMKFIGENYESVVTTIKEKQNDNIAIEIYERNYIIYFTYVLGIMQSKGRNVFEKEDFINGEVYKNIEDLHNEKAIEAYNLLKRIKNGKTNSKNGNIRSVSLPEDRNFGLLIPDFLVHISHDKDNDFSGQKFIMEAKTTSNLQQIHFYWDLLKLNIYIDSLTFNDAAYVIVNTPIEKINEYLAGYILNIHYLSDTSEKLWFFIQNWDSKNKRLLPPMIYQLDINNQQIFKDCITHQAHKNNILY